MRTAVPVTFVVLLVVAARGEPAAELLGKGVFQEETAGNSAAAMELYRRAADSGGADGKVVAEALYRLGRCQVRTGQVADARATFRRLIEVQPGRPDLLADLVKYRAEQRRAEPKQPDPTPDMERELLQKKLKQIVIPVVEFKDTPIEQVCQILKRRSKELDADGEGVNVLWFPAQAEPEEAAAPEAQGGVEPSAGPDAAPITVTLAAENLSLGEIFPYIATDARVQFRVDTRAVVIAHVSVPLPRLESRFFRIGDGVLDTRRFRRSSARIDWGADDDDDDDDDDAVDRLLDLRKYFASFGVTFPTGSRITLYRRSSKLFMHNTPENLERVERILQEISITPRNVTATFELIEVLDPQLVRELRPGTVHEQTLKALPADQWRVLSRVSDINLSGNTVVLSNRDEPLRWDEDEPITAVGARIELTPTMAADEYTINLEIKYTYREPTPPPGRERATVRLETQALVWDGDSLTAQMAGGEGEGGRQLFLIITANLLDPAGMPLRTLDSTEQKRSALRNAIHGQPRP